MARRMLVTGATGGIGAALVRAAADRGYRVLAVGRDAERLDRLCAEVAGSNPVLLDLRRMTGLPEPLAGVERLDAVVHCAGVAEVASVEETPYPLWLETLTVNVAAVAEITRGLLPALRRAAGHVVFINAAPGLHGVPRWSAYAASKAALRELADSLREEEAGQGLRVTSVYPGGTATELLQKVRAQFGRPYRMAECIQPATLASVVLGVLDMRGDAYLPEVSVVPTPVRSGQDGCETGAMGIDDREMRVREVRGRLVREGPVWTRGPERDFETVTLPERDCDLLRDLLIAEGVETVVEVGLAYGSSALAIGEALVTVGAARPRHLVIDPFQEQAYADVGWDLMRSAGLDSIAELLAVPSSAALPGMIAEGVVADAAFVDGSHRFHEVFVDLYFLRQIVRPGGLVVLDDHWTPSVRAAVRYYERNLGWTAIPGAFADGTHSTVARDPAAESVPRCVAMRLPDPAVEPAFEDFHPF